MNNLPIYENDEPGFTKAYNNGTWAMGVKNFKPLNDINTINQIERHLKTDEIFVPVVGETTLVIATELDGKFVFEATKLENGKFYCVKQGLWHNAVMSPDAKVVLVEMPDTSPDNSEFLDLSKEETISFRNSALNK